MLRKIGKHLEMDDLHYNVTRRNQHEVSSNEQVQPLDEFPKDLRQDEMGEKTREVCMKHQENHVAVKNKPCVHEKSGKSIVPQFSNSTPSSSLARAEHADI